MARKLRVDTEAAARSFGADDPLLDAFHAEQGVFRFPERLRTTNGERMRAMTTTTRAKQAILIRIATTMTALIGLGCAGNDQPPPLGEDLTQRAYIVSEQSDELTIIDLRNLSIIGRVATGGVGNHMGELSADLTKVYVSSPETNEIIVVDVRGMQVMNRIGMDSRLFQVTRRLGTASHPTHVTLSPRGDLLAVMAEHGDAVVFIDPRTDQVIKTLGGFHTPHFLRYTKDGRHGYVANLGAHQITRVDLQSLTIEEQIPLDGMATGTMAPDEGGFADAQIGADGVVYAADRATGRVLAYDTVAKAKLPELYAGPHPSIVYAEHPFANVPLRLVPNWGDMTVAMLDARAPSAKTVADAGDHDSNGVNYTSLAPDKAFVMNRLREDIAVVDTATGTVSARIPVGGNTETASTTPDGRWIVATVSSAAAVVVIDARTNAIVKRFDGLGKYPWSVSIPFGQNYCH
jgi:DNA-binding beta-propeller fold protein YncE